MSGKRDSNSRPRPWQGRALPTELFPLAFGIAKVRIIFKSPNTKAKKCYFFMLVRKNIPLYGAEACLLRPESTPMCSAVHSGRGSRAFYGQKARLCAPDLTFVYTTHCKSGINNMHSKKISVDFKGFLNPQNPHLNILRHS